MKAYVVLLQVFLVVSSAIAVDSLKLTVTNGLQVARDEQTIELHATDLAPLGQQDLTRIHVRDEQGKDLLCQAVDTDGDYTPDMVIFQTDLGPNQSKVFTVYVGDKWVYTKQQFRAYGRFVRERFEDFCWENDRIAQRMYGKALETWQREPLTSSAVDIWSKRTSRLVINDWYMVDNYHTDTGEGADFYSAGPSRGCGGNGLWAADRLWVSRNFVNSRVLANGPIRVLFELTYEPFEVNGVMVEEIKRISLDAGSHLNHFVSIYKPSSPGDLVCGIGIKKVADQSVELGRQHGWLVTWERMEKSAGQQGLAIIVDPNLIVDQTQDQRNILLLVKVPKGGMISYWAGFCWDKAGQFKDQAAWASYVDNYARCLLSPVGIKISAN